jgi:hypothetical protein
MDYEQFSAQKLEMIFSQWRSEALLPPAVLHTNESRQSAGAHVCAPTAASAPVLPLELRKDIPHVPSETPVPAHPWVPK